jgi:hypothetical protein
MSHLSHDELLEAAEGGAGGRTHLDECRSCRRAVEELEATLREAAAVEVPEPSPLFWRHFSDRVSEAVRQEAARSRGRWRGWLTWRLALPSLALLLVIASAGRLLQTIPPSTDVPGQDEEAVGRPEPAADADAGDDESWRVFSALALEADSAGAPFGSPAPGLADGAVLQMSDEERGELIRLLKDELERGGARIEG